jgi:Tol biopolymer transport system component
MAVSLDGKVEPLYRSYPGVLHYHPKVSPDGQWVVSGAARDGVRQLCVMCAASSQARAITALTKGDAPMWAHWKPDLSNHDTD